MTKNQLLEKRTALGTYIAISDQWTRPWEDAVEAYDLIEKALEDRPKVLAHQMLSMLEVINGDVRFKDEAIHSTEFEALSHWASRQRSGPFTFVMDQAYNVLDYVADNGLDNLEDNFPEPDVYTDDILSWLAGTTYNLGYVTEALQDGRYDNANALLSMAQFLAIADIWTSLGDMLRSFLK